jgi:hypothetical protein
LEVAVKKVLLVLTAAVVLSFVYTSPAAAQVHEAVVKVPFSFIVGQRLLPAGTYRIAPTAGDWAVVSITGLRDTKASPTIVQTVVDAGAQPYRGEARVSFLPYGGQAFLQEIAVPGTDPRRIIVTRASADRALAKLNLMNSDVAVPAK